MKVVFTGEAAAHTFNPLIAVAEELNTLVDEQNIADARFYYFSNKEYDKRVLYENGISFRRVHAGSSRHSVNSFLGKIQALFQLFALFPDVVFATGGSVAYPILWAAKKLSIPVIIHESNSVPDDTLLWAASFAQSITTTYKQTVDYFKNKEKLIQTGQPIRHNLQTPTKEGAYQFLGLDPEIPIIWFLMGSGDAKGINRIVEEALPELLQHYQVVHQTGKDDFDEIKMLTDASLMGNEYKNRYHPFAFLNQLSLKMLAGVSDLVISRAGASLFEIAYWNIPSIIIPMTSSYKAYQIKNAYAYAREGGCLVIEENNLSDSGLIFEINRLISDARAREKMIEGAKKFAIVDAEKHIAKKIIDISLSHEK